MVAWAGIIGAALFGRASAQVGSWQTLAGYQTASDVGPHSMIDLDMEEIESATGAYDFTEALRIYESGGNGFCVNANDNGIGCEAGWPWGNSLKATSIRTLKGFAIKDYASETGDYAEQLPPVYMAYWAANGYSATEAAFWADTFITKDYSAIVKDIGRAELIEKGANYQAVWMYVLHELEDAIGDCFAGDVYANDGTPTGGAPHAWDEGWAFYAGSLIAATAADAARSSAASQEGILIWELAEKRGYDFGTTHSTGPAMVNVKLLAEFIEGRDLIIAGKCLEAEPVIDNIIKQMSIPLIQGTLKYAYQADPAIAGEDCTADSGKNALTASDACVKSWADAWAFAAAVLPRIDQCSSTAAKTVKDNLDIAAAAPMAGGFAVVQSAMESTYACLGITCADVGTRSGFAACTDPTNNDWGTGNGWCMSDLDKMIGSTSDAGACWTMCENTYGSDLTAIDWTPDGDCYCQDACECMDSTEDSDIHLITSITVAALPNECVSACPAQETAFEECVSKQQSLNDDFFADDDGDDDDDDFSPNTCADVQQHLSNGECEGPAVCQTEYQAYVECHYEDMAQSFLGLTCDLSCSGNLGSDAAQRTTAALGTLLGTTVLLLAL